MKAIAEHEPVAQASLAKAFDVAPPSMTVMVQRLERDGWVCRHDSDRDFRTSVTLTDKGRNVLPAITQAWARVDAELRDAIGDKEAKGFSRAALALRNSLGGEAPHDHLKETVKGQP